MYKLMFCCRWTIKIHCYKVRELGEMGWGGIGNQTSSVEEIQTQTEPKAWTWIYNVETQSFREGKIRNQNI